MQTEPNQLADVFTLLNASLIQTAPLEVTDPKWTSFLDSYSIFQQLELNKLLKQKIAEDPTNQATGALLRAHTLFERTRARMVRIAEAASRASEPLCPERQEAMNFLLIELADGDRPAKELIDLAQSIGISPRTLKRAKAELNIVSVQRSLPNQFRGWVWSLNPDSTTSSPNPTSKGISGGHDR